MLVNLCIFLCNYFILLFFLLYYLILPILTALETGFILNIWTVVVTAVVFLSCNLSTTHSHIFTFAFINLADTQIRAHTHTYTRAKDESLHQRQNKQRGWEEVCDVWERRERERGMSMCVWIWLHVCPRAKGSAALWQWEQQEVSIYHHSDPLISNYREISSLLSHTQNSWRTITDP